jgi:hypothetical protein
MADKVKSCCYIFDPVKKAHKMDGGLWSFSRSLNSHFALWPIHFIKEAAKVAVILDSSRAFPKEHLKFKPLTTVYVPVVHTLQ